LETVACTSSAMVVQLGLIGLGMAALLGTVGAWFEVLRWFGAAYLIVLGIRQWRAPPLDLTGTPLQPRSVRGIYLRGLLVSLTNPKTLFFFGAFFPQFIAADRAAGPQVLLLSATFLTLALLLDSVWVLLAGRLRPLLRTHGRLRNRVTGGVLVGGGVALALDRLR
jgi:threonine/homoserine/homoserine lactone efflux protein